MKAFSFYSIFLLMIFLSQFGHATTIEEQYLLSERCGTHVENFYKEQKKEADRLSKIWYYENHYNKVLNECFVTENSRIFLEDKKGGNSWVVIHTLFNMNDHKQIAEFSGNEIGPDYIRKSTCDFKGIPCASKKEWDRLIKSYMED